jgi:large subunit ribosomal protein L1
MVEFRSDRTGVVHSVFGKASFEATALKENLIAVIRGVAERKPDEGIKGRYIKKVSVASTMGPGITIDLAEVTAVAEFVE